MLRQEIYAPGQHSAKAEHPVHGHRAELHRPDAAAAAAATGMPCSSPTPASRSATTTNATPTIRGSRHTLTLEVDSYGNVLKQAAVGYGRRHPDPALPMDADRAKQTRTLITYTENLVTNPVLELTTTTDTAAAQRRPAPTSSPGTPRRGDPVPARRLRCRPDPADPTRCSWSSTPRSPTRTRRPLGGNAGSSSTPAACTAATTSRRLLALGRCWNPWRCPAKATNSPSPPGYSTGLPATRDGQPTETLIPDPAAVLGEGGYVDLDADGDWWIPAGRVLLLTGSRRHPGAGTRPTPGSTSSSPYRYRDPFGNTSTVSFDGYDLLMRRDAGSGR